MAPVAEKVYAAQWAYTEPVRLLTRMMHEDDCTPEDTEDLRLVSRYLSLRGT
jgi:hypothetical protein